MSTTSSPPRRPRRVWRILKRTALVLLVLAILARLALPFVLPLIVDGIVKPYGVTLSWESLDLGLIAGDVQIRGLTVHARSSDGKPTGDALMQIDLIALDLLTTRLLRGELHLALAEVDGVDARIERDLEGRIDWALLVHPDAADSDATAASPTSPATDAAPDLRLPVIVDVLRAQHLRLHVVDRKQSPPLDTWIETNLRVNDLGREDREGRVELHAHGPDLLDELSLEGRIAAAEHRLKLDFRFALRGLRLRPVAPLLAGLGIVPTAGRIDAGFALEAEATTKAGSSALGARVTLSDLSARADDAEGLAVDRLDLQVDALRGGEIAIDHLDISGPRARVELLADGNLAALGVELRSSPRDARAAPSATPGVAATSAPPPALRVDHVAILGGDFRAVDHSVEPPVEIALGVDELRVESLRSDPRAPDARATATGTLHVDGVAQNITLTAELVPFATRRAAKIELRANEVTLQRLAPHLRRAGFESVLAHGELSLHAESSTRSDQSGATLADITVGPISLRDGTTELFALESVAVQGLVASPTGTRIDDIDIAGLSIPLVLDAEHLSCFGLRTIDGPAAAEAPTRESVPPPATTKPSPRFELARLRLRDARVHLRDDSLTPPLDFAPEQIEIDLQGLALGGPSIGDRVDTARVRARLVAPSLADEIALSGELRTRPGPLDASATLELVGTRMVAGPLDSLLRRAGIECGITAGRLHASLTASARTEPDGALRASCELSDLQLADGDAAPFVSLAKAKVAEVRIASDLVTVGPVTIDAPHAVLARDADGALRIGPILLRPKGDLAVAPEPAPAPAPAPEPTPPSTDVQTRRIELLGVSLTNAAIAWTDAAVEPSVQTEFVVAAELGRTILDRDAEPTRLTLDLGAEGALETLHIDAEVRPDPLDLEIKLALRARGMRAGPLAAYLPRGATLDWNEAAFEADAELRLARPKGEGTRLEALLHDAHLRDGERELFTFDRLSVRASRIDLEGGVVTVEEIASDGLALDVARHADGSLSALGVQLAPPGAFPSPRTPEPVAPPTGAEPTPAATTTARNLPRIAIDKIDVGIARLGFRDADAPPLDFALRVFNRQPLVLLDKEPEALPPILLAVEGRATPLVDAIKADITLAPWRADAHTSVTLDVSGLHGTQVATILPSLAARLDCSALDGGSLHAELLAEVDLHRRHPTDIDLSRGFGLGLEIRALALRATADGEILAGIESITVDAPRVVPGGETRIDLIDIAGIKARAGRTERGLELAGITFLDGADEVAATAPDLRAPIATPAPRDGNELRIGELSVRGLDFVFRDDTSTPPMVLPLDALDVEVRGFTTRTLTEGIPFRFSASLGAGKVELPERIESSSIISGFLGAAIGAVTGRNDDRKIVQRPMLDEIAVDGDLALGPALSGRVRASISGLELGAFRGPARKANVEIGDGVVELGTTIRLLGSQGLRTNASINFNNLSVTEPAGGPISTYLKLPAPLDTVLFALRDQNGDIRIPLDLRIADAGLSSGQIATAAITALGRVIADAVAAAPFRAAGMITGLFGFGGKAPSLAEQKVEIPFDVGDTAIAPAEREALRPLVDLLASDESIGVVLQQQLGASDLARAAELGNPSLDEAHALADRLRRGIANLQRDRDEALATLRATIGAGDPRSGWLESRQLRDLDAEIAQVGNALDRVLALLRPGAERRTERRTRNAAVDLGAARLEFVRQALLDLGGPSLADRIESRPARVTEPTDDTPGRVTATPRFRQPQEALGAKKQVQPLEPLAPIDSGSPFVQRR